MADIEKVMGWLKGLTFNDWRDCYSDSEVSNTAKAALELLKEQANAYGYLQKQFFEVQDQLLAKPEIIRCKDCSKRGIPDKCPFCIDAFFYVKDITKDDGFCFYAEKKVKE